MTNHYTLDQLNDFPWIVSTDTLRPEDLLPKFWSAAETCAVLLDRPQLLNPGTLDSLTKLVGEDSSESDWDDNEASETLQELFEALNDVAPAAFYFGASDDDGACFGFWLDESWGEALQLFGLGDDDPTGWASLIAELEQDGIDCDNFSAAYCGEAEGYEEEIAGANYAAQLAEDLSPSFELDRTGSIPWPFRHVDWNAAWRELQIGDGYRLHRISGETWAVFRSV